MKKIVYPAILIFCCVNFLNGQITIESDELYDSLGVVYNLGFDTIPDASIDVGTSGNFNWDFSALAAHDTFSRTIMLPTGTPFEGHFPDADIVIEEDSAFVYYNLNNGDLNIIGAGTAEVDGNDSILILFDFEPQLKLFQFPITYNSAFSDVSKSILQLPGEAFGGFVDSIRIETTSNIGVIVDGFGTLTLPQDTLEALRMERRTVSLDTTYILVAGDSTWTVFDASPADTTLVFNWVTNENGWDLPVVTVEVENDSSGNIIATDVEWLMAPNPKPVPPSSSKNLSIQQFELFPNPTTDVLNIQWKKPFVGMFEVVDFNGKIVKRDVVNGISTVVHLENNHSGNYVFILKSEEGKIEGFKQFVIQR